MTCSNCGVEIFAGEAFCENCGQNLAPAETAPPCADCGGAIDADGYCQSCGVRGPDPRDHMEVTVTGAAAVTDKGLRHSRNEDAMAVAATPAGVAAVVCDGVSSSPRPQDASKAAADTALQVLVEKGDTREAVTQAASAVAALADSASDAPACTYVSALTTADTVTLGWVGDSRAYWLAGDRSRSLTVDDSWAAQMVMAGALTEAEANVHVNAHVVVAWLGADAGRIDPHVTTFTPDGPGAVLVCSDGLWNYLPAAAELAEAAPDARTDPLAAAQRLTRIAIEAGGRDNITVVIIPISQEHAE